MAYTKDSVALGAFLGMAELYAKGLVTPEHFAQQCIAIAKEYHEKPHCSSYTANTPKP